MELVIDIGYFLWSQMTTEQILQHHDPGISEFNELTHQDNCAETAVLVDLMIVIVPRHLHKIISVTVSSLREVLNATTRIAHESEILRELAKTTVSFK